MHELSIAESIMQIASRHARGRKVHRIEVRVGHLRQVVPAALTFAFDLVAVGTSVEGAQLVLEEIPAAVTCGACGAESHVEGFPLACANCGTLNVTVIRGEELSVDTLELEAAMA